MTWNAESNTERKRFKAIRCLTCSKDVPSRASLRFHKNHDVRYVNLDGTIAD